MHRCYRLLVSKYAVNHGDWRNLVLFSFEKYDKLYFYLRDLK